MQICKACGGQIEFGYLEEHICPTPNPAYEAERDKYRRLDVVRRQRLELVGIEEFPSEKWIFLEIWLRKERRLTFVVPYRNFRVVDRRLMIDSWSEESWSERIPLRVVTRYRFRTFTDEASARAFGQTPSEDRNTPPMHTGPAQHPRNRSPAQMNAVAELD